MPAKWDRTSTKDFLIPIEVLVSEGANPDITEDQVWFCFVEGGLPIRQRPPEFPDGWTQGYWITERGQSLAGVLVGPANGGLVLAPGKYAAWIHLADDPTVPQDPVDTLEIG